MDLPLVSCIMPTANRQIFVPYAIDFFLHQDYPNAEFVIIDDSEESIASLIPKHPNIHYVYNNSLGTSLGKVRNIACEKSKGEIIVHWDDDDWYAQDWVSQQVNALISSGADITGLCDINFFSAFTNKRWTYRDTEKEKPWVYGGTLAYWKSFWSKQPFHGLQAGEDNDFIWKSSQTKIHPHNYIDGYISVIHRENSGILMYEDPRKKIRVEKWMKKMDAPEVCEKHSIFSTSSDLPLVSCIMPTANRKDFIPDAIANFLKQDYMNAELVIIDDGKDSVADLIPENPRIRYFYFEPLGKIGTKRNIACEIANGELITHWDDDDWYAQDWISHQVQALINADADICGIDQVQFFAPALNRYWMTKNSNSKLPWLTGASLIYRKSFWEQHPFKNLQIGEDDDYIRNSGARVFAHDYFQGFIARLHLNNTSIKFFEDEEEQKAN